MTHILAVISLVIVLTITGCSSSTNSKLDKATFESFAQGIPVEEVQKAIGVGEKMAEGSGVVVYQYYGKGSIGANANFTFQDGKLVMKAQTGLK